MLKRHKQDRTSKNATSVGCWTIHRDSKKGTTGGREGGDGELLIYEFRDSLVDDARF